MAAKTYSVWQGYRKLRRQVAVDIKFCALAPDTCGPSAWNLFDVTLLAFWRLEFRDGS
jgi:hypothetical protein